MKIHHIWSKFPAEDVNRILDQCECELDLEFAGFTTEYAALAAIIPRHFTILDCGCYLERFVNENTHKLYSTLLR